MVPRAGKIPGDSGRGKPFLFIDVSSLRIFIDVFFQANIVTLAPPSMIKNQVEDDHNKLDAIRLS